MEEPKSDASRSNVNDGDLPFDILIEILSRLPIRSLVRFTSVCKSWYSFIRSPSFISTHMEKHTISVAKLKKAEDSYIFQMPSKLMAFQRHSYTLLRDNIFDEFGSFDIPVVFSLLDLSFIGNSCNGIICFAHEGEFNGRIVFLFNPSIKKIKLISHNCFLDNVLGSVGVLPRLGFGYCERSGDFKVVRIQYIKGEKPSSVLTVRPQVEIYSLNADCWRQISVEIKCLVSHETVSCNGVIYWLVNRCGYYRRFNGSGYDTVVSFDLATEEFNEIELPPTCNHVIDGTILVFNGLLALFSGVLNNIEYGMRSNWYEIWVMNKCDTTHSWSKVYTLKTTGMVTKAIGFTISGKVLLIMNDKELVCWDPLEDLLIGLNIERSFYHHVDACFTGSLVLYEESSSNVPSPGSKTQAAELDPSIIGMVKQRELFPYGVDAHKIKIYGDDVIIRVATNIPAIDFAVEEMKNLCCRQRPLVVVTGAHIERSWTIQLTTQNYSMIVQQHDSITAPDSLARFLANPDICFVITTANSMSEALPGFVEYGIELGDLVEAVQKRGEAGVLEGEDVGALHDDYSFECPIKLEALPLTEEEAKRFIYRAYVYYKINHKLLSLLEYK